MGDDMIGRRFGKLTVLEMDHPGRNGPYYLCECDCGRTIIACKNNLKTGNTTSCGCKRRKDDLIGKRFGRLLVIDFDHMSPNGKSYWLCECDCGNKTLVNRTHLLDGHVASCGCWNVDSHTTHGMAYTSLHNVWTGMKQRCTNEKHNAYHRYGGRGIYVCDDWKTFENFRDWALTNGYDPTLTIDRKDNSRGYYPENCRWVDNVTQQNNREGCRYITYNDITHTAAEWARIFGVKYPTFLSRLNRNDMQDFENYFNGKD